MLKCKFWLTKQQQQQWHKMIDICSVESKFGCFFFGTQTSLFSNLMHVSDK